MTRLGAVTGVVVLALAGALMAGSWLVVSVPLDQPDLIVSLASHDWERLPEAARLAERFPGALVLLTRPDHVTPYNCHDCEHRPDVLVALGLERERIQVRIITAPGTFGEALMIRDFMKAADRHRLLVVTSPYHTRRTLGILRHVFSGTLTQFGVVPASRFSQAQPATWWLAGYDRFYVTYEWAALFYYAARYGVVPPISRPASQPVRPVPSEHPSLAPAPGAA